MHTSFLISVTPVASSLPTNSGIEIPPQPMTLPMPTAPAGESALTLIPLLFVLHCIFRKTEK